VRVIDDAGNQIGVLKTRDALNMAIEKGLDLVEIAPTAQIPVCRIMDYGKYKFEKAKKEKEAKKRQVIIETKEVQLSWNIDTHDFNTRVNYAKKFIEGGNKVKASLELNKGREMAHIELGYQMLEKFEQACLDFCVVEKRPIREGRRITMFFGPKKVKPEDKPKPAADKPATSNQAENPEKTENAENTGTENT
jgi:translation initiation factor IF-3